MHTKAEVVAALDGRLPQSMNMGIVGNSVVVVMNMQSNHTAQFGLMIVGGAINTAIEAATQALLEYEVGRDEPRH